MDRPTRVSLLMALATPMLYFGGQVAAAPFFPDFSVLQHSASQLGSDLSTRPEVLNTGAMLTGVASIGAAWGLFSGLRQRGVWRIFALLMAACAVSFGLASLWAGAHPLPDPAHDPGALGAGMFAAPFVALLASLQLRRANALRIYLALNAVGFGLVAGMYSGALPVDLDLYGGAVQRLGAWVMLGPLALVAAWLLWSASDVASVAAEGTRG
jgi:hypothetical protein